MPLSRTHARIAELLDQHLVVGGDHDGRAELVQFLEQVEQAHADPVIDVAGRLVGQQEAGTRDDGAGDGDALLLSARQGGRLVVEVVAKADPAQQFGDMLAHLTFLGARDPQGQCDVVQRRQVVEQPEVLEHDADPPPQRRQFRPLQRCHVMAEHGDEAARRAVGKVHEAKQRRLAGAAGAGQEMERPRFQCEADIAQHFRPGAVAHADILETNQIL